MRNAIYMATRPRACACIFHKTLGLMLHVYLLHIRCSFLESKQRERQGQHHFFLLPGRSVQLDKGEFLCPLCQSPCNTVLPLLIPRPLTTPPRRPTNEISPAEWIDLVEMATELADGDHMDTSEWEGVCSHGH